jgi:ribosomal protein L11 methyltransferase
MPSVKVSFFLSNQKDAENFSSKIEGLFFDEGVPLAVFENMEGPGWIVSLYFEGERDQDCLKRVMAHVPDNISYQSHKTEILDDTDWVTQSLSGLGAVRAGRFVVYGQHARDRLTPFDIGLHVEAGRAFGTGHHATTEGCLQALDWIVQRYRVTHALDVGCGTAVLAIALAKAARSQVIASDIDPVSVNISKANVALNKVTPLVRCLEASGLDHPMIRQSAPYDVIVANILKGPLLDLAPHIASHCVPGGLIVLSGLLVKQKRAVLNRYRALGCLPVRQIHLNGWATLILMASE